MEDKKKTLENTVTKEENQGYTRYDSQYDEKQSWAEEAKEDLETWIEEQGIYIRQ
ncbi:MAG: hypothetical protein ACI4WH_05770 [Oscillospiraceae bacterium]